MIAGYRRAQVNQTKGRAPQIFYTVEDDAETVAEQPAEKKKDQYRRNRREQSRAAPKAGFIIAVKTKTHAGSAPESEKYGAEGNLKQR